jgi:hypothetical protein
MKDHCKLSLLAGVLISLLGCTSLLGPDRWHRQVGMIDSGPDFTASPVVLPEVVEVGIPFSATVYTLGSGSCTRPDGAEVEIRGQVAHVTPYVRQAVGDVVCTDDLVTQPREVRLRFDTPGEAVVRVHGRPWRTDRPGHFDARIMVQP